MNRYYRNFKMRLISLCMVAIICVIVVIHFATYMTTMAAIEHRLIIAARGVAVALAHHITMNIEPYKEFSETRDINSDYYKAMQEYFMKVKDNSDITYIYTERRLDAETVEYILDAEIIGSENHSPPGALDTNEPRKEQIYLTGYQDSYRFSEGSVWGDLVVSYAPIFDKDGSIVGLLGVDIDIREAYSQLGRMQVILIITYIIIVLLVAFILIRYSNTFLESLLKDKLTGAYSKRYLDKIIKAEIKSTCRDRREDIAIMLLDLDYFKKINDTYGHEFGDKVLRSLSETINGIIRREDYFIRYGGEEFVVVVTRASVERVLDIANRIRKTVEDISIINEELAEQIKITVSIGVGTMKGFCANTSELIELADKALYEAKQDRNRVVCLSSDCQTPKK